MPFSIQIKIVLPFRYLIESFPVFPEMQHRLMGQPIIPTNPYPQYNLAAMQQQQQQQNLIRAQQLGGQLILSPRLATPTSGMPPQTSQHQALMGMPPTMVSSADAATHNSMLYSMSNQAALMQGQTTQDLSQYGLMNQALLDYNSAAIDPSAAGMSNFTSKHFHHHPYVKA